MIFTLCKETEVREVFLKASSPIIMYGAEEVSRLIDVSKLRSAKHDCPISLS